MLFTWPLLVSRISESELEEDDRTFFFFCFLDFFLFLGVFSSELDLSL